MKVLLKKEEIVNELKEILTTEKIYMDKSLKEYTSFKIGGNAAVFVEIENVLDAKKIFEYVKSKNIKHFILGAGTNVVFSSNGFSGIVIKINIDTITILDKTEDEIHIKAGAGLRLKKLCEFIADLSYGDVAKIYGIPGSIGGGIIMNAGAYGLEMKDILESVTYIDENFEVKELKKEDLELSYRNSVFTNKENIILYGVFKFKKVDKEKQLEEMEEILGKREKNQPLDFPSAGSVFKRGKGFITSKLIDDLGLKGLKVGDAVVSQKHAGFIINLKNATSDDVKELVKKIKEEVKTRENKYLETEIIFID